VLVGESVVLDVVGTVGGVPVGGAVGDEIILVGESVVLDALGTVGGVPVGG